jgi:hypothetical protein
VGGWRARNANPLEAATKAALLGLIAWGVIRRPAWRNVTVAGTAADRGHGGHHPPVLDSLGRDPARGGRAQRHADHGHPHRPDGDAGDQADAEPTQRRLLTGYWRSFVAHPLSRMQTGTTVLAEAEPGKKASVLDSLRKNVAAVNDWAVGHRGPERAFIATSALGYVLPFAVGLGALAMVAACAQTILFLLCLAGPFVLPVAVAGRRHRRALVRFWLAPLLGSLAVLAAASLLSFVVVRAAETLHASDEYVGLLLAGSTWPALAAFLIGRWLTHRRQRLSLPPAVPADAANAPRS